MPAALVANNYGKSAVRLVKVVRDGAHHDIHDFTVDVRCKGDFAAAHIAGDNSAVLATDTMKNTVYALARQHDVDPPEAFAATIGAYLLTASRAATRVTVEIAKHSWRRIDVGGRAHDSAFEHGSAEDRIACVTTDRSGTVVVEAGVRDLVVLRSAGSAFSGFPRDRYTTLKETRDRIMATAITARWRYTADVKAFNAAFSAARAALTGTFATHASESVQHTLYAMGDAALAACPEMKEIRLSLPNKHHLLVDLSPFGLDNPNEIFVSTTEPYGLIEATLRRER
ncbi:MAG: factor-independent urate hydroxylase [Gemmatimonadales bacterium]